VTDSSLALVHSVFRRLAAFFVVAIPVVLAADTWGASRVRPPICREARVLTMTPLATRAADTDLDDERSESAVVLVVLDGVRWQEIFNGVDRTMARQRTLAGLAQESAGDLMPNLHRLIDSEGLAIGAPGHGAEIAATGPQFISLPGYIEIFDGKPDFGCFRNDCAPAPARTVADQIQDASGVDDVALVSSWPNIARAASASPSFALTAGRKLVAREETLRSDEATSRLIDQGARASAFPGDGDYRPDSFTKPIALRVLASEQPRFLFVGLGDADEYAHRNDYRGYLAALRSSDEFLGQLTETLHAMGSRGRHTTVLVTADHGRAYNFMDHGPTSPESGRVWLVAAGADVHGRGLVAAARRHTLSDVAPTERALLGIAEGDAPPIPEIISSR
jgi:hypothetical protein